MAVVLGAAALAELLDTAVDVTDAWRKRAGRWSGCWGAAKEDLEGVRLGDGERGLAPRPGCRVATGSVRSGLEAPESGDVTATAPSRGGCAPRGDACITEMIWRGACCRSWACACVGCRLRMCLLRLPAWLAWYEQ